MSGTIGYPWSDGQFLKAAALNAAIAGTASGTGTVSAVGSFAITLGGPPANDVNAVLAFDPTTLVLYVRLGSGWSPAGKLFAQTATPPTYSVPFGWQFGSGSVPTFSPTTTPTSVNTSSALDAATLDQMVLA